MTVDPKKYVNFVDAVTSQPSKDHEAFIYRLQELEGQGFSSERLLTASVGMCVRQVSLLKSSRRLSFKANPLQKKTCFT